eukprot:jgi/Botrbrau1/14957/Bobra.0018s0060.1
MPYHQMGWGSPIAGAHNVSIGSLGHIMCPKDTQAALPYYSHHKAFSPVGHPRALLTNLSRFSQKDVKALEHRGALAHIIGKPFKATMGNGQVAPTCGGIVCAPL